jgi:hypothetical protein
VANDYVLITTGNRYVKSVQVMGRTHMIAVAVERREKPDLSAEREIVSQCIIPPADDPRLDKGNR